MTRRLWDTCALGSPAARTTWTCSERRFGALGGMVVRAFTLLTLVLAGCQPCAGLEGEALAECEANEAAEDDSDASSGTSSGTTTNPPSPTASIVYEGELQDPGEWESDNSEGVHQGATAVHPPTMDNGDVAEMTFDCEGAQHTQMRFFGHWAAGAGSLKIYIDGEVLAETSFPNNGAWHERVFNVAEGTHIYTFRAEATQDTPPAYVLDSFQCLRTEREPATNLKVDFDDGFVPVEIAGDWRVDNVLGAVGETAIHPPWMNEGDTAEMTFNCNDEPHTQMRFSGHWAIGVGSLTVYVDGEFLTETSFPNNGAWHERVFNVPEGPHTYTFRAEASEDTPPAFVLDAFECNYTTPEPATNLKVDFDDGFVPVEISGDWVVDNVLGAAGETAIHPPWLSEGSSSEMTFNCNDEPHTQMRFSGHWAIGVGFLKVYLDGVFLAETSFPNNGAWHERIFNVSEGPHTYTFRAEASEDTPPAFLLDTFECNYTTPEPATNLHVDFDDGFVPVEIGGDWVVDNVLGAAGEASVRPPWLDAGDVAEMTFDCAGQTHTRISFSGHWAIGAGALEFYIDDERMEPLTFPNNGAWHPQIFDVAEGTHSYSFVARAEEDTPPAFLLDDLSCE